jgi:hypothetical protein
MRLFVFDLGPFIYVGGEPVAKSHARFILLKPYLHCILCHLSVVIEFMNQGW